MKNGGNIAKNKSNDKLTNRAFIDGQNLHMGISHTAPSWKLDFKKLRNYLRNKFNVAEAYYYLGYRESLNEKLKMQPPLGSQTTFGSAAS